MSYHFLVVKDDDLESTITRRRFFPLASAGAASVLKVIKGLATISAVSAPSIITGCSKSTKPEEPLAITDLPGTLLFAHDASGKYGDGKRDIVISRFDSEDPTNLTPGNDADNASPLWWDNGRKIIFASNRTGSFNIFRINDLLDPVNSLEQLTDSEGDDILPELSPNGDFILYYNKVDVISKLYKLNLVTGENSVIMDPLKTLSIRFLREDKLALVPEPGKLAELDLTTGLMEPYIYNDEQMDELGVVSGFDLSRKNGMAYASLDISRWHQYFRVVHWPYDEHKDYTFHSGGSTVDDDNIRSFRVLDFDDFDLQGDYILHTFKNFSGEWKVAMDVGLEGKEITGVKTLRDISGSAYYPDWTPVEHIEK